MQFNETTNGTGIIQNCENYTDLGSAVISGTTATLKQFTNYINATNDDIWSTIYSVCSGWSYDDSNYTDLPQATTNMVSGTSQYALPTDAITIQRIEAKDANGTWVKLKPLTKEKTRLAMGALSTDTGAPTSYFPISNGFQLYPKPNYNSTAGIRVYFDRSASSFVYTDTTKTPGFASTFHDMVPLGASIKWLSIKQPTNPSLPRFISDYSKMEAQLIDFYSTRFKDNNPPTVTTARQSYE